MKTGDIVTVFDGSYSMKLVRGKMERTHGNALARRHFQVHGIDGNYPTDRNRLDSPSNDTLLVDVNDPDLVLFTQERFCRVVTPRPAVPKETMEVSVSNQTKKVILLLP